MRLKLFDQIKLERREEQIAGLVLLREIKARLRFLETVAWDI